MISNKMKRVITFSLAFVMIFTALAGAVFANEATPIKSDSDKIQELVDKGYIEGYGDGSLGEDRPITRAELAAIVVRALGLEKEAEEVENTITGFADVSTYDWHNGFVAIAKSKGVIKGYTDNTFKPNNNVIFSEVITMMTRMLLTNQEQSIVNNSKWPESYLQKANELGLLDGVYIFDEKEVADRGTVFLILSNVVNKIEDENLTEINALVLKNTEKELVFAMLEDGKGFEKNDTVTIKNEKKVMEQLSVGSVYTLKIDKDKKVKAIDVNEDAIIHRGEMQKKRKDLIINGKTYNIDSVLGMRHNDKEVKQSRFPYKTDFAKATIFEDELVYVSSHSFDEVVPVKEIKRDRIFGISEQGGTKVISTRKDTVIKSLETDKNLDIDDIKSGDIAYIRRGSRYIDIFVTQDVVEGTIKDINVKDKTITIDEEKYNIEDSFPVMLIQDKRTLPVKNINRLEELKEINAEFSININNKIQVINTDEDISLYGKSVIEKIGSDRIEVVTEDGFNEVLYVTEYTELLEDGKRDDRDDRYGKYNIKRVMSKLEEGDIINALTDGRGDIEELEVLKGKKGIISNMDWGAVTIDGKERYLAEDNVIFSVANGKYEVIDELELEEEFYKNEDIRINAIIFEEYREIGGLIIERIDEGPRVKLKENIINSKDNIRVAEDYKDSKSVKAAITSLRRITEEIERGIDKADDKTIEKYEKSLKNAIEVLNKNVLNEILLQIEEKIELAQNTNKLYNKEALKEIIEHCETNSKVENVSIATIRKAEEILKTFDEKVYEDIVEEDAKLNKLQGTIKEELKAVELVLERAVYNDSIVNNYKSFLRGLNNATSNLEDIKIIDQLQSNLEKEKVNFDKSKFDLSGKQSELVSLFHLEERVVVSDGLLKIADNSNETIVLKGAIKNAKSFIKSAKGKDVEKIDIDKLSNIDLKLRNSLVDLAARLNIESTGSANVILVIAEAEITYDSLIATGDMKKAFELNESIFELKAYARENIEQISIDKVTNNLLELLKEIKDTDTEEVEK